MNHINHSLFLQSLSNYAFVQGGKAAIISKDETVTYAQLWDRILRVANYLKKSGIGKGDIILLSAQKEIEFVYLYFAAHLLGTANVIIDPTSNETRKDYIIGLTRPKAVFGLKGVENSIAYEAVDLSLPLIIRNEQADADDVAEIMFTTGTTGNPKGVLLTHANIAASASNINEFIGNTDKDVEAIGLPICHSFGLGRLRCNMLKGATVVMLGSFANLKLLFHAFEKYQITGFGMVPAVWEYIKKLSGNKIADYKRQLRYIEIGSAVMNISDKELLSSLFPNTRICMHYGLTEASRSLFMEFHGCVGNLNTIGKPVSDAVEVKIMDENGKEMPQGEPGEVCVAGNMVMKSYFLTEDTANAFWGRYFRTGDYGYQATDGYYYLIGRKKELINVGGKKVSPIEIEDAIIATGGVMDCICVSMADPKGMVGEVPKAYLLKSGASMSIEEIAQSLIIKLEHYKLPVAYEWIDEIPKTSSGKKQRLKVKSE